MGHNLHEKRRQFHYFVSEKEDKSVVKREGKGEGKRGTILQSGRNTGQGDWVLGQKAH